jgi:hypothetical protein
MNEQIEELAKQTVFESYKAGCIDQKEIVLEKFAEAIVRKCIKAAGDPGDGLIKGDTWHDGVRASIWSIQQEFGLDRNFGIES